MSDEVLAVTGFFHEPSKTVSYVVSDHKAKRAAVIDPVRDYDHRSGKGGAQQHPAACLHVSRVLDHARKIRREQFESLM